MSRLITQDQLDRVEAAIQSQRKGTATARVEVTDDELAAKLVELDVLSPYQVAQLKEGRTRFNLGPYIITDFIGQGGMGQVFKAVHEMMGRESAVKVLPLNKSTPEAIINFTREIRTQAQLDHPNLVRAYDAGHDGNVHYLVTEYVPGTDLRRLIRSQGRLSMQQAANVIMQSAEGLEYAHQRGLIHRDVKPGNILVTPDGRTKVSDLGLAGFIHLAEEDPRAGKIVGTPDYLAPEQIRNPGEITSVSDIYSMGCTLYYAVTGKVPFPGGTTSDKARRHCEETPWHPKRFNPDISEEFVEIIADMMEKDPDNRIQTAAEVASRLEPWAGEVGPMPEQQPNRSRWMPPPLPTGVEQLEELTDTDDAIYFGDDSRSAESASQWSQTTDPLASSNQDTLQLRRRRRRAPPPLTLAYPHSRDMSVPIALAVSIPVSLLAGVILGFMLRSLLG